MTANPTDAIASHDPVVLRGVCKHFGSVHAVDGVDLNVRRGELFGLIGHNGAGKSTLFKMMLGLIAVSAGDIHVAGAAVQSKDFRAARRRVGYLPENLVLYDNLSARETLNFFARLKGVEATDCTGLLQQVGLSDVGTRAVSTFSKGMRQRLGFAQALLGQPQVLFLDEPSNGLDPSAIRDFYGHLHELRARGITIVITSHILADLQTRVDRLAMMANGKIRALGSVAELRAQFDLPLTIRVHVVASALATLQPLMAAVAGACVDAIDGGIAIHCPRGAKVTVVTRLAQMGGDILDLDIHEPSLEDLFFGVRS